MERTHQFLDEWIVRAVASLPEVTAQVIAQARSEQKPYLGQALLRGNIISGETLLQTVERAFHVPGAVIPSKESQKLALALVPQKVCEKFHVLPLRLEDNVIELAMANPLNLDAQSHVQALSGREVRPFYCAPDKIEALISECYSGDTVIFDLLDRLDANDSDLEYLGSEVEARKTIQADIQAPVIKLVNSVISKAVHMRASDIHLEHGERTSEIRYRIDGGLRSIMTLPKHIAAGPMVSRLKIMANLDVADRMRPQDGRALLRVGGQNIGLRVSTLPTSDGEKAVLRIIDPKTAEIPLESMGFRAEHVSRLEALAKSPQGVVVVTGPTGSGKTSTLYALLNRTKSEDVNVVTVEDPIEFRLQGINQVQVNEKQGLGFASVLRSVLRQDPDVILVGEIRDQETASVAFQAAMTGHLVLTTLHTNDAVSAVMRLADMGVERFKIGPALLAVTAQRLVRRLCVRCRKLADGPAVHAGLAGALAAHGYPTACWKPVGCEACQFSGYAGRLALLELLELDQDLRDAVSAGEGEAGLRHLALRNGRLHTFLADALSHLATGDTSAEEVLSTIALPAAPAGEVDRRPAEGKRRVLVADDDPDMRVILRRKLEATGYEVEEVPNGQAAVEALGRCAPSLLLLDLMMPVMGGEEVLRKLRGDMGLKRLPVIVLTANDDEAAQLGAFQAGADDYVVKPIKPAILTARIEAAFRRHRTEAA